MPSLGGGHGGQERQSEPHQGGEQEGCVLRSQGPRGGARSQKEEPGGEARDRRRSQDQKEEKRCSTYSWPICGAGSPPETEEAKAEKAVLDWAENTFLMYS